MTNEAAKPRPVAIAIVAYKSPIFTRMAERTPGRDAARKPGGGRALKV